jgi:hypothetical protein
MSLSEHSLGSAALRYVTLSTLWAVRHWDMSLSEQCGTEVCHSEHLLGSAALRYVRLWAVPHWGMSLSEHSLGGAALRYVTLWALSWFLHLADINRMRNELHCVCWQTGTRNVCVSATGAMNESNSLLTVRLPPPTHCSPAALPLALNRP